MLFITHDLGAGGRDRRPRGRDAPRRDPRAGRRRAQVFERPQDAYTQGAARLPAARSTGGRVRLPVIDDFIERHAAPQRMRGAHARRCAGDEPIVLEVKRPRQELLFCARACSASASSRR